MNFDPENPNWTAYALGELSENEAKDYEQEVKTNPEAAAFVSEVRAFSQQLEDSLQPETVELNPEQRESVKAEAKKKPKGKLINIPYSAWGTLTAAAAVLVLVGVGFLVDPRTVQPYEFSDEEIRNAPSRQAPMESPEGYVAAKPNVSVTPSSATVKEPVQARKQISETERMEFGKQLSVADSPASNPKIDTDGIDSIGTMSSPMVMTGLFAGRSAVGRRSGMKIVDEGYSNFSAISPSIEHYDRITGNVFKRTDEHPLSTFSIDVDTASYSNMRRFLKGGQLPPKDSIRIEELINYFSYDYPAPDGEHPFAAHMEMHPCPWNQDHQLLKVGLQGKELAVENRPAANLVFLLDVSGSMNSANKLPLVKRAMRLLVKQLGEADRISIVVYAGASGLVLPATSCDQDEVILAALERLSAGGGTNGGAGIDLAYKVAQDNFVEGGINRVILCTDGDFNIGTVQTGDLTRLIEDKAKNGVFLTVLGFGMGNLKDSMMEELSNKGNGNYGYIDTFSEARKMLVDQLMGTLVTIAKDVKIQVDFNPAHVAGYRLIGYENRRLNKEDFNDDKKDAGEIGAGHTVTAFYEIIPAGIEVDGRPAVDESKYVQAPALLKDADASEWLTLRLRYKQPDEDVSTKLEIPFAPYTVDATPSQDYLFASAVAEFGLLLRDSEHAPGASFGAVLDRTVSSIGTDKHGYRREFLELVRNANALK